MRRSDEMSDDEMNALLRVVLRKPEGPRLLTAEELAEIRQCYERWQEREKPVEAAQWMAYHTPAFLEHIELQEKQIGELRAFAIMVKTWEADLISDPNAWAAGDGNPRFTDALYEKWRSIQDERNRLLGECQPSKPGRRSCSTCQCGPECTLGLERTEERDGSAVCDPGDWDIDEAALKDCWIEKEIKSNG